MGYDFSNAFGHLKSDKVMDFLIRKFGHKITFDDRYDSNYSKAIANLIIEQQVSFKAAITIKKRFALLIENLSFQEILDLDDDKIQSIGVSFRKVAYIKNVFSFFIKNEKKILHFSEEKLQKELISIKGIGKWTVEMFLMFELGKPNIFSKGDIALINSVKKNYKMDDLKNSELDSLIKSWSPYNSTASLLLWKSIEEKVFFN